MDIVNRKLTLDTIGTKSVNLVSFLSGIVVTNNIIEVKISQ